MRTACHGLSRWYLNEAVEPVFTAEIVAEGDANVVARITKRLWVRKKSSESG